MERFSNCKKNNWCELYPNAAPDGMSLFTCLFSPSLFYLLHVLLCVYQACRVHKIATLGPLLLWAAYSSFQDQAVPQRGIPWQFGYSVATSPTMWGKYGATTWANPFRSATNNLYTPPGEALGSRLRKRYPGGLGAFYSLSLIYVFGISKIPFVYVFVVFNTKIKHFPRLGEVGS